MRFLTTRQVGELCGEPEWLVRRVVDHLDCPIDRFGHKRMIPADLVPRIEAALREHRDGVTK